MHTPDSAAPATHSFRDLAIAPAILTQLDKHKFVTPTPIQHAAIPVALEGKDVIGIAQTGTGKTLAFGIPMMQHLITHAGSHGLIVVPTRELALQVEETLRKLAPALGMNMAVLIGGASMHLQRQMIRRGPRIVIATPGRLIDHLEQRTITLKTVKVLVLDEADRMLDMGFAPQIKKILVNVPAERQTMLFSATMPANIVSLATSYMKLPLRIEVAPAGTTASLVEQELFIVKKDRKLELLGTLLKEYKGTVLVFSRTKHGAKKMTTSINAMGHRAAEIHSNRTLGQRKEALAGFKNGRYRVLVATDIAARGIDVTGIELVVNFDLPDNPDDYVHRIGRTARAGMKGKAISFASPDQRMDVASIERLIRKPLPRSAHPVHANENFDMHGSGSSPRSYGSRPPRRFGSGGGGHKGSGSRSTMGGGRRRR
ncbi:MAG: DEAD/DEAH box helicase [Candidatus Peribacteraceae bacterium]|nr:DEAD/DEAH box helicase [Candidatus Peribacteraceae bacterium]